jgi:hypothetical protein
MRFKILKFMAILVDVSAHRINTKPYGGNAQEHRSAIDIKAGSIHAQRSPKHH